MPGAKYGKLAYHSAIVIEGRILNVKGSEVPHCPQCWISTTPNSRFVHRP